MDQARELGSPFSSGLIASAAPPDSGGAALAIKWFAGENVAQRELDPPYFSTFLFLRRCSPLLVVAKAAAATYNNH